MVARGLEVLRAARQRAFTAITSSEHRDVSLDMWRSCDPSIQSDERDAELLGQRDVQAVGFAEGQTGRFGAPGQPSWTSSGTSRI